MRGPDDDTAAETPRRVSQRRLMDCEDLCALAVADLRLALDGFEPSEKVVEIMTHWLARAWDTGRSSHGGF